MLRNIFPVTSIVFAIFACWYAAVIPMNIKTALTDAERAGVVVTPENAKMRRDLSTFTLARKNPSVIFSTFYQIYLRAI